MTAVTDHKQKHMVLGTAGHIDHGKSSLIKALTGVDPDRLSEEKRRGITIELGFAELALPDGTHMGVVDVPGHERFVRQMIAGASGIDIALLCIAADDGIMPQTCEHLAILEVLGIKRCVVALTKCDLVDEDWIDLVTAEIHSFLHKSSFSSSPIVAVSSRSGQGLTELLGAIADIAHEVLESTYATYVRYPIDRVFSIKGSGTVVTGTLWSGSVSPGDELELLPQNERVRVRSVQVHGEQVERAEAGNRVAINLNAVKTDEVRPGDFLASVGLIEPSDRFDAWVSYLDSGTSGKPLKSGMRLRVSHGTREVVGRILFTNDRESLAVGESAFAQLRLDKPLPLSWQDRFVLRFYSPARVVGGGMVLMVSPKRRTTLKAGEVELLESLRDGNVEMAVRRYLDLQVVPVNAVELSANLGIEVGAAVKALILIKEEKKATRLPTGDGGSVKEDSTTPYYTTRPVMQKAFSQIEKALLDFHSNNPTSTSVTKAALFLQAQSQGLKRMSETAFSSLLKAAEEAGIVNITCEGISHPKAGGGAREAEKQAADKLYGLLAAAGQTPPSVNDLIATARIETSLAHRALGALEKQGQAKRINKDQYFEAQVLAAFEGSVRNYLEEHEAASVAELKEAMNTSRKYAVPLLEYFDAQGITRRRGDQRMLM